MVSPPAISSAKRSGSVESRLSERSRREVRDRAGHEREHGRDDRGKDLAPFANGSRARTPIDRKASDQVTDRRRQEELLQARHEKLASDDRKIETRRTSRDGHRRDSEMEKDERKAKERGDDTDRDKERERDRPKDRSAREIDDVDRKRKRDEVSRVVGNYQCLLVAAPSPYR